ncbi:MAG TPA: hypothetical protein VGM98_17445 [Schlesneria sp.]
MQAKDATDVRDAQERYLLASLVPYVRAEGSRTIFADAFLKKMSQVKQSATIRAFESDILRPTRSARLSRRTFSNQVWELLGRTKFPATIQDTYNEQLALTLDEACLLLSSGDLDAAAALALKEWRRLMRCIGRRAGNSEQKIALDVISYEARAALHHCYSVTWLALIYAFEQTGEIDPISAAFLRFWHTVDEGADSVTLFHGHVFALHPATGPFILSRTGRALLGEWFQNSDSMEIFERLLNGIFLALMHYHTQRDDARDNRPKRESSAPDIQVVQEIQYDLRKGKRRQR